MNVIRRRAFAGLLGVAALSMSMTACASGDDDSGGDGGECDVNIDPVAATVPEGFGSEGEGERPEVDDPGRVGIAMPTQTSERWIDDGDNLVEEFESSGFETDLQFAGDDVGTQVDQIENMITQGADVLVIAAIDNQSLGGVLEQAKAEDITVIAYDRLIRETEDVDYYATFDNYQVGVLQAQSILDGLNIEEQEGTCNIELFAGSIDDNNAFFFYDGAMDTLQPYIDEGALEVVSGETDINTIATERWDGEVAQSRMDNLLSTHYSNEDVHAVLSPYDGISRGVIASLEANGYVADDNLPVVSGQDAEVASVQMIIEGRQTATIFKDTRNLASVTVDMVATLANGEEPEVNDTESYDNGVKVVPSMLLTPYIVTVDNYEEMLVDTGYLDAAELE
ncbi:multiple monosaccharide ABC transporter substrate-binding protein [Glycomyces salinus]|uniref:multiple monosaccharide ABC transporter substrate-binding protein n=1 Tax=Glycomyces salinus TaxID=980294 RepID=UPI0022B90718|nr:multiple monosaccharide ABC transporter substrate-binding protein [Glycomyces salinus]